MPENLSGRMVEYVLDGMSDVGQMPEYSYVSEQNLFQSVVRLHVRIHVRVYVRYSPKSSQVERESNTVRYRRSENNGGDGTGDPLEKKSVVTIPV